MHLIFTDLDGTLLNHENYNYQAAIPLLKHLKNQGIPIIPVTGKSRQEMEPLIRDLDLKVPLAVENGSAIFIPKDYQQLPLPEGEERNGDILIAFGCPYGEVREGLRRLEQVLGQKLKGFGDLTEAELQQLTNLSWDAAKAAKTREFTELFVPPQNIAQEIIEKAVEEIGLKVMIGARFYHLMGQGTGKGKAVKWLLEQYQQANPTSIITTIGLGDSLNDLEMLEVVDKAIIIPDRWGHIHPQLLARGWAVAPCEAPEGWVAALTDILSV